MLVLVSVVLLVGLSPGPAKVNSEKLWRACVSRYEVLCGMECGEG